MPRTYVVIFFLILLALVSFFVFGNKVGDVRPAQNSNITPVNLPLNLPQGYTIGYYSQNLGGVRDLEFSPEGTLIASVPSDGKVIALKNGEVTESLTNLNNPHGIAFFNNQLFVAEETKVSRYNWNGQTLEASLDKVLFDLPPRGNHFTRSLVFDKSGNLYISVGSTCNVCNEQDPRHAAVLISDAEGSNPRIFAKGLRNSVFMALNPKSGEVWATDMGRDFLGDNLPPDEVNILKDSKDYGWPNCYGNKVPDTKFNPAADCTGSEPPIFEIPAHSAPLGLIFDPQGDLLVAYHGSWNRSSPIGYKVVKLKINGNQVTGEEDFISGFLQNSQTLGRPVDLIFDKEGNLYISDDKAGAVYIVRKNN